MTHAEIVRAFRRLDALRLFHAQRRREVERLARIRAAKRAWQ